MRKETRRYRARREIERVAIASARKFDRPTQWEVSVRLHRNFPLWVLSFGEQTVMSIARDARRKYICTRRY